MNGLLVLTVALALPKLGLTQRMNKWVGYGFTYIAWSFTWFYWLGAAAANRALTIGDNPLGETDFFGVVGVLPAYPSVFLVLFLLAVAARGVLKAPSE